MRKVILITILTSIFQLNLVSLKFSTESKPVGGKVTGGTTHIKHAHSF